MKQCILQWRSFLCPNFKEVDGAYWFRVVHACFRGVLASVRQEPCMLGFWNFIYGSSRKNSWLMYSFLSKLSPFLELCPFEKIRKKSDACRILRTVHARVLKFHIWIPHGKIADLYFFPCLNYLPFWSYAPLKKNQKKIWQDITKTIWARGLKFGQLIGNDE